MTLRAELSEQQLQDRWETFVQPVLFAGRSPSPRPTVVLIGGQPGCGKTVGLNRVLDMYPDELFTPIIGDDLWSFHPDYTQAAEDPDETVMPEITAQASGAWVRMGIEHAAAHGYCAVVEGIFRNPETTLGTAARFAEAGHQVHVVALAVPETMSRLSCLERYYGERAAGSNGRWTAQTAHDLGYEGTPLTVEAAENDPAVHRLTIMDRAGHLLYDNTRGVEGQWQNPTVARHTLEARRAQPLTTQKADWWQSTATQVQTWAAQVGISPQTRDALEQLSTEQAASLSRRLLLQDELGAAPPQINPAAQVTEGRTAQVPAAAADSHVDWQNRPYGAARTTGLAGEIAAAQREAARLSAAAERRAGVARQLRAAAQAGQGPAMLELEQHRALLAARVAARAEADAARVDADACYATSRQAWQEVQRLDAERQRNPLTLRRAGTLRAEITARQEHLRETARAAATEAGHHDRRAQELDRAAGGPAGAGSAAELDDLTAQWAQHAAVAYQRDVDGARSRDERAAADHAQAVAAQHRAAELNAEAQLRDSMAPAVARREEAVREAHAEPTAEPDHDHSRPGPSVDREGPSLSL